MKGKQSQSESSLQRQVVDLRHRIQTLETEMLSLFKRGTRPSPINEVKVTPDEVASLRPTGEMVLQLRKRLGVSQEGLAKIMNVTAQSVYLWERKRGRLNLRTNALQSLSRARKLTRHEAQKMLHQIRGAGI